MEFQRKPRMTAAEVEAANIDIEKLVHGGAGLGRAPDGRMALIAGALPGETVRMAVERDKPSYVTGRTVEVVRAAPERIEPPCPHYAECGGCDLQHANYEAQIALKMAVLRENLEREGIELDDGVLAPPLTAPKQFGYRHRLRLHVAKEGRPGFHQRRTNLVSPIRRCMVATDAINAALAKIAAHPGIRSFLGKNAKEVELAECPRRGRITLLVHAKKSFVEKQRAPGEALFAEALVADCVLVGQFLTVYRRGGYEPVLRQSFRLERPEELEYLLSWHPGDFFQTNCRQNEALVALVMEAAEAAEPERALDLFCGTGNFSIPLALFGAEVLGVDNTKTAIEWAEKNAATNGLRACSFLCADATVELARMVEHGERFDVVVLDPPRQGLGRAAALLPQLDAKRIVSVSCDPASHARDLALIMKDATYRLKSVTMVDMFPQTHHIESVAVLERAGEGHPVAATQ